LTNPLQASAVATTIGGDVGSVGAIFGGDGIGGDVGSVGAIFGGDGTTMTTSPSHEPINRKTPQPRGIDSEDVPQDGGSSAGFASVDPAATPIGIGP
jgi:hypothetical protein